MELLGEALHEARCPYYSSSMASAITANEPATYPAWDLGNGVVVTNLFAS